MSTLETESLIYQKKFGENLRKLRLSKDMSQLDLAAIIDLDKTSISRIENGRSNVTLKTIHLLSTGLDIDPRQLMDFDID